LVRKVQPKVNIGRHAGVGAVHERRVGAGQKATNGRVPLKRRAGSLRAGRGGNVPVDGHGLGRRVFDLDLLRL
jgi:hypothetical protein